MNKSSGADGLTGEFYQVPKEELISTLIKLFQKIEEGGTLPNIFHKVNITLIPKSDKMPQKKKFTGQIYL